MPAHPPEACVANPLILVADDSATNREVIGRSLRLLGHHAEIVEDGRKALEAWRTRHHAALLTDCHMPVMDGFALAAAIRAEESANPWSARLPIIAITGSVRQEETARCLAAGMDACLAKPVDLQQLRMLLARVLPAAAAAGSGEASAATSVEPAPGAGPVDLSVLRGLLGDDAAGCREVLRDFVAPAQDLIGAMHAAVAAESARGLQQAAHKLKSAARSVGARDLADLCQWLETTAAENRLQPAKTRLAELDAAFAAVVSWIAATAG